MSTRNISKAFTLIELLVVVAIIALLIAILLPSLARARESGKRTVCASNLKSLATACATYAHDARGWWPTVATNSKMTPNTLGPLKSMGSASSGGPLRDEESVDDNNFAAPSRNVSPSRAFWLLIRLGNISPASFICPSSNEDIVDDTSDKQRFYDFKGYGYLSYGYQMPFYVDNNQCRPKQGADVDQRMVYLGDKNPGITRSTENVENANPQETTNDFKSAPVTEPNPLHNRPPANQSPFLNPDLNQDAFRPFNSPNHGGRGEGEGQNIGRADGSVDFARTPVGRRGPGEHLQHASHERQRR